MKSPLEFLFNYELLPARQQQPYSLLVHRKTNKIYAIKQMHLDSHLLKDAVHQLQEHRKLTHPHLFGLVDYQIRQENKSKVLRAIYRIGTHSLQDQINARVNTGKLFQEEQLWGVLYGIVSGLAYLQKQNISYGILYLDSAYLTQSGKTKILDPSLSQNPLILNQQRYYSPELLRLLVREQQESSGQHPRRMPSSVSLDRQNTYEDEDENINIFKSDVFSLAMCMMHCALLEPMHKALDYYSGDTNFEALEAGISSMAENYSEEFVKLIVTMLDESVDSRPDFLELQGILRRVCRKQQQYKTSKGSFRTLTPSQSHSSLSQILQVSCAPLQCEVEDLYNEIVAPSEAVDYQIQDKIDMSMDNSSVDRALQMPKLSTIRINDNIENLLEQSVGPFTSALNPPLTSISTVKSSNCIIKSSKQIKMRVVRDQNYQVLESCEMPKDRILQSHSLRPYIPPYDSMIFNNNRSTQENLFTDPKLLMMLREDLRKLQKGSNIYLHFNEADKENYHFN